MECVIVRSLGGNDMDKYYKMCVAAGFNYYRKVPNFGDLQIVSGLSVTEFFLRYKAYELAQQLSYRLFGKDFDDTIEETALRMIMKEKGNFIWTGERWITESEGIRILKDHPGDLKELMDAVSRACK